MAHVKIKYLDMELSVDEPDNYAALLEEIKDFDDEQLMETDMDDILITDSKNNEIKNNVDYNKYIKEDPTNKIIYVSLKKEEEKVFNLIDFGKELDEHFAELEKQQKEEDEKKKNENKDKNDSKDIKEADSEEEKGINYNPALDEFNYLSNRKNVFFLKQFWDVFETRMITQFKKKINSINNIANKDIFNEMKKLNEKFDSQNNEIKDKIKNINEKINKIETEQKKEINNLKEDIAKLKTEMINNIQNNMETKFEGIKNNIEKQNEQLEVKFNNIDNNYKLQQKNLNEEFGNIKNNFESNNENINKQFSKVENNFKKQIEIIKNNHNSYQSNYNEQNKYLEKRFNTIDENSKNNYETQKKEISESLTLVKQSVEEHSPIKIVLINLTESLNLKEIIKNKAKLKLKITNLSKVPINNYLLKQKENANDIVKFKEIEISMPKDDSIIKEIELVYTGIKEYYDPPYIQILLTKESETINEIFASFEVKDNNENSNKDLK